MTSVPSDKTREPYSEEDQKLLVALLIEYSDKLSTVCDKIEVHRTRKRTQLLSLGLIICAVTVVYYFVVIYVLKYSLSAHSLESAAIMFAPALIVLSYLFLIESSFSALSGRLEGNSLLPYTRLLSLFNSLLPADVREERLIREAKLFSKKLDKIVRIISQIQDHSQKNIPSRIEMDFRLTDAELVLERSLLYTEKK
jgi:hypothetical protein